MHVCIVYIKAFNVKGICTHEMHLLKEGKICVLMCSQVQSAGLVSRDERLDAPEQTSSYHPRLGWNRGRAGEASRPVGGQTDRSPTRQTYR